MKDSRKTYQISSSIKIYKKRLLSDERSLKVITVHRFL